MFVDRAQLIVQAGAGGNGCSALFQEPFNRHPRPTGGDGGHGGDVILLADPQLTTLLDFQFRHEFKAGRGGHGGNNNKTGKHGVETVVRIPVGTLAFDVETSHLLRDFVMPDEQLIVAKGGRGGIGNANARRATPGQPGERRKLRLELKLIADVGLVGMPNAGKSSLLRRISPARPKVAAYPFTTKTPVLGVVQVGQDQVERRAFVACDIPGLIEGAHTGRGLGIQFLRHIERTALLVHVIDMAATEGRDPFESYQQINRELVAYNPQLSRRPQIIAANKMDLAEAREHLARFRAKVQEPIYPISTATGQGLPELLETAWQRLQAVRADTPGATV